MVPIERVAKVDDLASFTSHSCFPFPSLALTLPTEYPQDESNSLNRTNRVTIVFLRQFNILQFQ